MFIGVRRWGTLFNHMPITNVLPKKKAKDHLEIHWKSYIDGGGDDDNVIICLYICRIHIKIIINSVIY
jgi:hypothetical protein